jgi:hypothetical protein
LQATLLRWRSATRLNPTVRPAVQLRSSFGIEEATMPKISLHRSAQIRNSQDSPVTFLQNLLGATAFLSAIVFFISWIYNRRYFEAFGLHGYSIRYPTQDYILNAKSVLSISLFVLVLLFATLIHPISTNRKFRLSVSLLSGIGLIFVLVYLVRDIWISFSILGIGILGYKTSWPTLLGVITLLLYSIAAPTILFDKAVTSREYRKLSRLIAWSGLMAIGILLISLASNFIGSIEGSLDASVNSRLLSINIAAKEPLGFGIQPDLITQDENQGSIYVYYNLRFLTQYEGVLYVLRPEQGVIRPLVHVLPVEKAYILTRLLHLKK